jgi:site-specific recombinase XerD
MAKALQKQEELSRARADLSAVLPAKHLELTMKMLEGYRLRLVGGSAQKQKTADRTISAILDFITFSGKAPWLLGEAEYERWGYHVGVERQCSISTQRIYQGAVRDFYTYLTGNLLFINEARNLSGVTIRQVSYKHNSIVHKVEGTGRLARDAMQTGDFNRLMEAYVDAIQEAAKFRSKSLYPLMRDRVLFFLVEDLGLRADEALGTDLCDFTEDSRLPESGEYAAVSVIGKGGKPRTVLIENPLLPPMLKFYFEKVRPHLMKVNNPNETAMFLSERGGRLLYNAFWARFQNALALISLDCVPKGKRLSPHSLRHTSVTEGMVNGRSLESNRMKHGHTYAATTQGYGHVPDEFISREIIKGVRNNQKKYREAQQHGTSNDQP